MSKPTILYANAYVTDRLYGGPEEGGWWYDTGEPVMILPFIVDESETIDEDGNTVCEYDNLNRNIALERLYELCVASGCNPPEREYFQRHDWNVDGFKFFIEDKPGEFFPRERPHYE